MMQNPWKLVKENIIYQNKFGYTLHDDDVITPAGNPGKFMVLEHNDFAIIVAVTPDNKIIMVRQWRYSIGRECLELPAGSSNKGENLIDTAKRELLEETNYISDDWQELKVYKVGTGAMRINGHIFLAKNAQLSDQGHQDDTEVITVETYSYSELLDMIDQNIISDDKSLLSLLLVKKYL